MDNDLISREALKKAINDNGCRHSHYFDIFDVIDNAPTVDAYEQGYTDGWKERYGEPNERPQGEWLIIDDTEQFIAKCSVCGRIEDSRMVKDYPFCHCGADMRGSKE